VVCANRQDVAFWDDYEQFLTRIVYPDEGSMTSSWNGGSYFWVSYYDGIMGYEELAVFDDADPATNYDTIYQYDPLVWTIDYGWGTTSGWEAHIFTASTNQEIDVVSFYTTGPNTAYEVYVYTDANSGPRSGTLKATKTGTIAYSGYHTVTITPVPVSNGQKFSVVVKLTTPNDVSPKPLEYPLSGFSSDARASAGQSYVSSGGSSWTDIATQYWNTNVFVKAFGAASQKTVANFNAMPGNGVAPLSVQFGDLSTANPTSWQWNFGDGTCEFDCSEP